MNHVYHSNHSKYTCVGYWFTYSFTYSFDLILGMFYQKTIFWSNSLFIDLIINNILKCFELKDTIFLHFDSSNMY